MGRRIFDNLKKAMAYILAIHVPIAGLSLIPVLFKWPLILLPVHIVFMELIIDPACSIVFEAEPEEKDIMRRPPRDAKEPLFGRRTVVLSILQGLSVLAIALAVFVVARSLGHGENEARALTFATLVVANLGLIFTNRSWSRTFLDTLRAPNAAAWWSSGGAIAFLGLVLYVPFLQELFRFETPHAADLLICLAAGARERHVVRGGQGRSAAGASGLGAGEGSSAWRMKRRGVPSKRSRRGTGGFARGSRGIRGRTRCAARRRRWGRGPSRRSWRAPTRGFPPRSSSIRASATFSSCARRGVCSTGRDSAASSTRPSISGVPLIVVLGHTSCGAVQAALAGGEARGEVAFVIESLRPAVERALGAGGDTARAAVRENVASTVSLISSSGPVLAPAVARGAAVVAGAVYDIESGEVLFLPRNDVV